MNNLSVGTVLVSILGGCMTGVLAVFILLYLGNSTEVVIYGATTMQMCYRVAKVACICCFVTELIENTSAREVLVDVVVSFIWVFIAGSILYQGQLITPNVEETFQKMLILLGVPICFSAFFSNSVRNKVLKKTVGK